MTVPQPTEKKKMENLKEAKVADQPTRDLKEFPEKKGKGINVDDSKTFKVDWLGSIPYLAVHAGCIAVIWVGISWIAVICAVLLYLMRMFFITAFYHRYFSHRSFRTSRVFQFIGALGGCSALQRGPIWWAAHHRHHHNHSDSNLDRHSPREKGFFYSHMGWFMTNEYNTTDEKYVADWMKVPELRFINHFYWLAGILLAGALLGAGALLEYAGYATSPGQLFVWGFLVSTVGVYHGTYTINSLAHVIGKRRFKTTDDSRNNLLLALITMGEGWHNNHHHYSSSARQGFRWWEIDLTYCILKTLSWFGIVWNLRPVPKHVMDEARSNKLVTLRSEQENSTASELETAA
ncbi:MAG: acyl-CoA desaturase [Planctomycetota bacterium]